MTARGGPAGDRAPAWLEFALACRREEEGRTEAAAAAFEDLSRKYREAASPEVRQVAAWSLMRAALLRLRRGDAAAALRAFEEVVRRYASAPEATLRESAADALLRTGLLLLDLEEPERALLCFEDLARRFAADASPALSLFVAQARFQRADTLLRLRRLEEAMSAARSFARDYARREEPAVRRALAAVPSILVRCLGPLRRFDEIRSICAEAVSSLAASADPEGRRAVVATLLDAAAVFQGEEMSGDQLNLYDEVLRLVEFDPEARPGTVATVLLNRGACLARLGRPEEELRAYDEIVARFGDSADPEARRAVAMALANRGLRLLDRGDPIDAIAPLREAWDRRDLLPGRGRRILRALRARGISPADHGFG